VKLEIVKFKKKTGQSRKMIQWLFLTGLGKSNYIFDGVANEI
jgi:hypothetical protein